MTHRPKSPLHSESTPRNFLFRADYLQQFLQSESPRVETFLENNPDIDPDQAMVLDLILTEIVLRQHRGESPQLQEYIQRFPDLSDLLQKHIPDLLNRPTEEAHSSFQTVAPHQTAVVTAGDQSDPATVPLYKPSTPGSEPETISPEQGRQQATNGNEALPEIREIGNYEILGELGRGGMGVVYQARQKGLNRLVALKMILSAEYADEAARKRFQKEAQTIARLNHSGFVRIFEIGSHKGKPFFTLEYVRGGNLAQKLDGTPMAPKDAAELVESLATAMHIAHQAGVIHRDLKPGNVLLAEDGSPRITDFGLARHLEDSGQSGSGGFIGTPSYMAPEQTGKSEKQGPPVDIYAMGAILYECLTGHAPFKATTPMDTVLLVMCQEPVAPRRLQPGVPKDLETICLKCLQKEPARRYEDAQQLALDLRRFQNDEPIQARPVSLIERGWRWGRKHPAVVSLVAVLAVVLLAGIIGGTTLWNRALEEQRRAKDQQQMVRALSGVVIQKSLDETEAWLGQFFEPVEEELLIAGSWGQEGVLDEGDPDDLNDLIAPLIVHHPQICSMMIANHKGREHMLLSERSHSPQGKSQRIWSCRITRRDEWGKKVRRSRWNHGLEPPATMAIEELDYDPRLRPWYKGAISRREALPASGNKAEVRDLIYWTKPYTFFTLNEPGITASTTFKHNDLGDVVIAFDVLLEAISDFTTSKQPTAEGTVLVLTNEGRIIGLPASYRARSREKWKEAFLQHPSQLGLSTESEALKLFSLTGEEERQIERFESGGRIWWAGARPFSLGSNLRLWILIVIPESDLQSTF